MRRDVCYTFNTDFVTLYNAYLQAAQQPPFERSCSENRPYSFSFGLNYSWKYNMNGGACTLHFMPRQNGSAVCLRFSMAQLGGARYESYADYLTEHVVKAINTPGRRCVIDMDEFLKAEKPDPRAVAAPVVPVQPPRDTHVTSATSATPPSSKKSCPSCHKEVPADSTFCCYCGEKILRPQVFCTQCGTKAQDGDRFCCQCGHKL